jgi:hypothetical protein
MKLTPLKTLAAGAALILLANAVALTGVYLNRSGEVDSRMTLSQREFFTPWGWARSEENSGLALRLEWRVVDASAEGYYSYGNNGGMPGWLDEAHMAALGFATKLPPNDYASHRRFERSLPRTALLVLEMGGPAWQQVLDAARQNASRHEAARLANADSKEFADKAKGAQEQLRREETINSRLFAIDAGLDRAALRAKYPDRSRYLILQGTVRPRLVSHGGKTQVSGYVSAIAVSEINVPHALRPMLEPVLRRNRSRVDGAGPPFEVTLAVGQRLEPWLESVRVKP